MTVDRFTEVKAAGVGAVARAFGVVVEAARGKHGGHFPCPVCGSATRHTQTSDRRGACGIRRDGKGWRCFQCDVSGDAATLAAYLVTGKRSLDGDAGVTVLAACADRGLCTPLDAAAPKQVRPVYVAPAPVEPGPEPAIPAAELQSLWAATLPVNRTMADPHVLDMGVCFYLSGRGWYPSALAALDLVRVTPLPEAYVWPEWWPKAWATAYRLVMRAYSPAGDFVSLHGRSIVPDLTPKTRWPKGYAAGHLFADARGVALLRGEAGDTDKVVVVEGMTDTIALTMATADAGRKHAILGITSGATKALADVKWPAGIPVVVFTDADEAGERYAAEIEAAIPSTVDVRRARAAQPTQKAATR